MGKAAKSLKHLLLIMSKYHLYSTKVPDIAAGQDWAHYLRDKRSPQRNAIDSTWQNRKKGNNELKPIY
jgi:hypothetical protein